MTHMTVRSDLQYAEDALLPITPHEAPLPYKEEAPHILLGLKGLVPSRRVHRFTIAILSRSRVAGIKQVVKGLVDHIGLHAPAEFSFIWFDGNNDEKTLMTHTTNIINHYTMPYDAIVPIGSLATQIAARTALLLNVKIPIIFTSISNPSHVGLVYSGSHGRHNITGISVNDNHYASQQINMLQTLKKSVQSILLPYDPQVPCMHQQITEMARLFLSSNIQAQILPIQKSEIVTNRITPLIHSIDTIITLRNELVVNHMPSIVTLCNDYGVTVFTSDLGSVEQGAAIGFSPKESTQGIEAARYLLLIFKENARPDELPVKEIPVVHFVGINESALDKQGIHISPQDLDTIQNKILYKKEPV